MPQSMTLTVCVLCLSIQVGTWYRTFENEYRLETKCPTDLPGGGQTYETGTASYIYPNTQRPSTAWYHDHT